MNPIPLETKSLLLTPQSRDEVRASIEQLPPEVRRELSPAGLVLLDGAGETDPWIHGFTIIHRQTGEAIGKCGFKGPPDAAGMVEIAYGIDPQHQGKGYATQSAAALVDYAFGSSLVSLVLAHTLPQPNASTRVLTKCGFTRAGEVIDPEDGPVWRWERSKPETRQNESGV